MLFCPICIDDIIFPLSCMRLPCGHCYHHGCVEEWFLKLQRVECPMCRWSPHKNKDWANLCHSMDNLLYKLVKCRRVRVLNVDTVYEHMRCIRDMTWTYGPLLVCLVFSKSKLCAELIRDSIRSMKSRGFLLEDKNGLFYMT